MDRFVETSSQGWLSRLGGSCVGVGVGLLLAVVAPLLLFWNEGRAVKRAKDLAQGREMVVEGRPDAVDPALEGKLVHLSGRASTEERLTDPEFGVAVNALRLERQVEMFQWKETKRTRKERHIGGSETTETVYEYDRAWEERAIDSRQFRHPEGHENPGKLPCLPLHLQASLVRLGAYRLSAEQVGRIGGHTPLGPDELPAPRAGQQAIPGGYYLGRSPAAPEVGDVRVTFRAARAGDLSVIAQQTGDTFRPLAMETGNELTLLDMGLVPAAEMFAEAEAENAALTWILRGVGFVLLAVGIGLVFRPLSVAADVIPFLGGLVGMGTGCAAVGLAAVVSLLTIGAGWVAYRPLLGVPLLLLGLLGLVTLVVLGGRAKARKRT